MSSSIVGTITVGTAPYFISNDGTFVWVTNNTSANVSKINILTNTVVQTIDLGSSPSGISSDGTYVWVALVNNTVRQFNVSGTLVRNINVGTNPYAVSSDGTNVWVANYGSNNVTQITASTGVVVRTISTGTTPSGISSDGTNVWVSNAGSNYVTQINASTGAFIRNITVTNPYGISSDGTNVWVASLSQNKVIKITASNGTVSQSIDVGTSPWGISSDGTNVWVSNLDSNSVSKINASSGTVVQTITGVSRPHGVSSNGTYVWAANNAGNTVTKILITNALPCFLSNSKILTSNGYLSIQDLRKGDFVKTINHGYKAIDMIGKREIIHPASKERVKNQLYECGKENYPDVFEPLIMTGCHSILVDWLTQEQGEKTMEDFGCIFMTDDKIRLMAYLDKRASVYETPGTYTIYHLALENGDYYGNYGIYANGLLVESCSKRYLLEHSGMEMIE